MTEQSSQNSKDPHLPQPEKPVGDELDASSKSLSEALRISFIILKVIMIVLVIAFLASGFETVGSEEQALVLRFGKIRGVGEKRVLRPGPHWILPYPIDEIVKIPVETTVNLAIDSFWYSQTRQEILSDVPRKVRPDEPLKPLLDGYCITRSEKRSEALAPADIDDDGGTLRRKWAIVYQRGEFELRPMDFYAGSDYNIVHTKWQLTYQIDDPERFFRNVYVEDIKPGDIYIDVMKRSITPLLQDLLEGAVVTAMVNYTIDEAISSLPAIPREVKRLLQEKLDEIASGIKVTSVQLTRSEPPRQVKDAFEASIKASQTSQQAITEAETYAENTINKAAGPVAFALLKDKKSVADLSEQQENLLWSQLAGTAQEKIAEARAYATKVEKTAEADAAYLQSLLPEYRRRPKLVIQQLYLDAVEQVLSSADEKFVIQTAEGAKGTETRILLNRDPLLKPKTSKDQTTQEDSGAGTR